MPQAVFICNKEFKITYWNHSATALLGYKQDEIMGASWRDFRILHYDLEGKFLNTDKTCPVLRSFYSDSLIEGDALIRSKTNSLVPVYIQAAPIRNSEGKVEGVIEIIIENVSQYTIHQKLDKLKKMALYDTLTEVGNRMYIGLKIRSRFEEIKQSLSDEMFGVLFLDIDKFKCINDIYGHEAGDIVLKSTAKCMEKNIREKDFIGRWGGEEFIICLSSIKPVELEQTAQKIRKVVEQNVIQIPGKQIKATISVGATMANKKDSFESLIDRVDTLMYSSKNDGRNCVTIG
jgi:diguanylate cyclase (GGDEF)-like protein/PAS domain S-box-containing protein